MHGDHQPRPPALEELRIRSCFHPQDYFGSDANGPMVTIVDPDIYGTASVGYCTKVSRPFFHAHARRSVNRSLCLQNNVSAPCKFIHHSGTGSACIPPGNPDIDLCHRYHVVTYSKCAALDANGSAVSLAGTIDVGDRFYPNGILKDCEQNVLSVYIVGYIGKNTTSPADNQERCSIRPSSMPPSTAAPTATPAEQSDFWVRLLGVVIGLAVGLMIGSIAAHVITKARYVYENEIRTPNEMSEQLSSS